jgi:hypothetical protein
LASAITERPGLMRFQHTGALPSPRPIPTEKLETNPRFLQLSHPMLATRLRDLNQRLVMW